MFRKSHNHHHYIFRRNTTYYTRVKIPPDLQPMFGLTEFRFSLYTPHRTEAKHLSQSINESVQQVYDNIRQNLKRGKMSDLSKDQLQSIIKEYVKDFIHNFELGEATGSHLNPYSHIDQLRGYDWVLSEDHDTLAERRHVTRHEILSL